MQSRILIPILSVWILPVTMACELFEEPKGQYFARMQDAAGLREGAAVLVAGVRAGRVASVRLDGDHARVDFTMDKETNVVVKKDACVSVQWYGAGEPQLRLRLGSETQETMDRGEVTCVESEAQRIDATLDKVTELLQSIMSGKGTAARLIHDEKLADKVERFFEQPPEPVVHTPPAPISDPDQALTVPKTPVP